MDIFIDIGLDYFSKYHYDKVSISEIVQKSGKGKSSFYSLHSSKEQFYLNIVTYIQDVKVKLLEEYYDRFENDMFLGLGNYQQFLKLMKEKDTRFLLFWKMLNTDPSDVPMNIVNNIANNELLKEQLISLKDKNLIRTDLDIDVIVSFVATCLEGIMKIMADTDNINDADLQVFVKLMKDALKYTGE